MAEETQESEKKTGGWRVKVGLAEMLKGGVIMDVTTADQAKIAEEAGACAVMALERAPADIRKHGGVARMADPAIIEAIKETVSIPVMAKVRIGHFAEAQILEAVGVDFIDESEVLTPADNENHIWKHEYKAPFVCGATCLAEALRRIGEGAAMIRTKGEAGTGNVVEAVRHMRLILKEIRDLSKVPSEELMQRAKEMGSPLTIAEDPMRAPEVRYYLRGRPGGVPFHLVEEVARDGKLPVPNFAAGGIATPADAVMMMQLGAESVFVGSGIFLSEKPAKRAEAIVRAVTHYKDAKVVAEASHDLGEAMPGLEIHKIPDEDLLAPRGI